MKGCMGKVASDTLQDSPSKFLSATFYKKRIFDVRSIVSQHLHPINLSSYFNLLKLQYFHFFEQDINFYFVFCFLLTNQVKVKQHVVDLQLQPLNIVLRKTLDLLQTKDPGEIFAEPVDTDEVGKGNKWLAVACLHRILFLVETSDSWKFVPTFLKGQ